MSSSSRSEANQRLVPRALRKHHGNQRGDNERESRNASSSLLGPPAGERFGFYGRAFLIANGILSRYQVWFAIAIAVQLSASILKRRLTNQNR